MPQTPDESGRIDTPEVILARLEAHVAALRAAQAGPSAPLVALRPQPVDDLSPNLERRRTKRAADAIGTHWTLAPVYVCLLACVAGCMLGVAAYVAGVEVLVIPACALCATVSYIGRHRALFASACRFALMGILLGVLLSLVA